MAGDNHVVLRFQHRLSSGVRERRQQVVERHSTFECSTHPSTRHVWSTRVMCLADATAVIDVQQIVLGEIEGVELR